MAQLELGKPTWLTGLPSHDGLAHMGLSAHSRDRGGPLPPPAHNGSPANPAGRRPEAGGLVAEKKARLWGP
jgi:hypothetical protein